ncbi:hypothetical protein HMPREF1405_01505 [Helicobacter pylori GAM231Ai]|nr:hypothetical protein HMPREF1405_01505 [Helicobacter pylori GAM231Ai]
MNKKDPKKARETEFLISYIKTLNILSFFARYWLYGCFSI